LTNDDERHKHGMTRNMIRCQGGRRAKKKEVNTSTREEEGPKEKKVDGEKKKLILKECDGQCTVQEEKKEGQKWSEAE